jgi:hypothetical protein
MRYYNLHTDGTVKGHYAVPQPELTLHLLDEPPGVAYKRDGVPGSNWIVDQAVADAIAAEDAAVQAQAAAKTDMGNLPGWASWTADDAVDWINTKVTDLASAKTAMKAMAKAIIYLRDHARIVR